MLRKILDFKISLFEEGKRLHRLRPLINAIDTFCYEVPLKTKRAPHIRDCVDLKRWMILVVVALIPCIIMAIWNTGLQTLVYGSNNFQLLNEYLASSHSFSSYFSFAFQDDRYLQIIKLGLIAFLPVMLISYLVGGFWELIFACIRGHEISEGFLVTGILYALILPSTIPYWMVAVGVSAGVVIGKELFGGTGMNILNPALISRCFLFFTFPTQMTGKIWVGTNPTTVRESILSMNKTANLPSIDGYSQASWLNVFNISPHIKRIHVDAIATNYQENVSTLNTIETHFQKWKAVAPEATLGHLTPDQMQSFVTAPLQEGGLALSPENFADAVHFSHLRFAKGIFTDGNAFFGNMIGSMGETSTLACLLGAFLLIAWGIGAWRSMLAMGIGAYLCALFFQFGSQWIGTNAGAWNPAKFDLPAYRHLLLGSLAFGLVFMITDPVSSPDMKFGKWIYGLLVGGLVIVIRLINPAFPEGVMLAILFGNVFAPMFDHISLIRYRKKWYARSRKAS